MAAKKLRPWLEQFHQHVKAKKEGDIILAADILAATKWSPVTLETHINKNGLAPFMTLLTPINAVQSGSGREVSHASRRSVDFER